MRSRVGARVEMVRSGIIARSGLVKNRIRDEHLVAGLEMNQKTFVCFSKVHQGARLQETCLVIQRFDFNSNDKHKLIGVSDFLGSNFQLEFILAVDYTDSYSIDWVIKQNITLGTFRIPVNILASIEMLSESTNETLDKDAAEPQKSKLKS
ncbi:hypothetical protein C5167_006538 [Papaver somniferum]|uniref:Uncharacterized protein n=1 Tax=Papaver somniferum TaxID=3469 RepID=A0A4Y7JHV1_PAPSO|nr:hypothetical protein C5167_006538 [Papaver somniferum]